MVYVIILIIILIWELTRWLDAPSLDGFWIASDDFLRSASLTRFILYIDGHSGFIHISDSEKVIVNQSIDITIRAKLLSVTNWISRSFQYLTITTDINPVVLPRTLSADFYLHENKLILREPNGNIAGILFRDSNLTAIARASAAASQSSQKTNPAPADADQSSASSPVDATSSDTEALP